MDDSRNMGKAIMNRPTMKSGVKKTVEDAMRKVVKHESKLVK